MRIIEKILLPNGLWVEFIDRSKPVAGDRWFLGLTARVPVPVCLKDLQALTDDPALADEFLASTGGTVAFELKKERNFVDAREKNGLFQDMNERLKTHVLRYLASPAFAKGVIQREFGEFRKRRIWWKETA